jgi:hypothetical protein
MKLTESPKGSEIVRVFAGYDPREAAGLHVFTQSLIDTSSVPVSVSPLVLRHMPRYVDHGDGTNAFITSRYLIPALCDYAGWALFVDGSDMVMADDVAKLWALRDPQYAIQCVTRPIYQTKSPMKYLSTPMLADNIDYPRKNWSSVMLMNCGHPANRVLTMDYVSRTSSRMLHSFCWLQDDQIGPLPRRWNVLIGEEQPPPDPGICHYTLGTPGFQAYADCDESWRFHRALVHAMNLVGQSTPEVVQRAIRRAAPNE